MDSSDFSPKIQRLLAAHDLARLVELLRQPADAGLRAQAALALGSLHDTLAAEALVRSTLQDPDPQVQAAARRALSELLGANAELAISVYRRGRPDEDDWLRAPQADADEEADAAELIPDEPGDPGDLDGFVQVARYEPDPRLRLKAIRALGRFSDLRAADALADLIHSAADDATREAAQQALHERYGSLAGEIIASRQDEAEDEEEWDETDDDFAEDETGDDEEEEEGEEENSPAASRDGYLVLPTSAADYRSPSSVVSEEKFPRWALALVVLLALLIVAVLVITRLP